MKAKISRFILFTASIAAWILGVGGCSTAEIAAPPAPPVAPPAYVQVPHPAGFDLGDVRAIFMEPGAPKAEEIKDCDSDLTKLKTLTPSVDELAAGTRELIKRDPVKYHWCFYGKVLQLESELKTQDFVDERQKKLLEIYGFLTPVGRAYMQEFHDSRYMRWAVRHYRQLSEWVFYRKLELTPQTTVDLVETANPFGFVREAPAPRPVLEKYGISKPDAPAVTPKAEVAKTPVETPTAPVAAVEPATDPFEAPAAPVAAVEPTTAPPVAANPPAAAPATSVSAATAVPASLESVSETAALDSLLTPPTTAATTAPAAARAPAAVAPVPVPAK